MKVKNVQIYSGNGALYNEDRGDFNKFSAWVLDGATGLEKNVITQTSDAAWLTEWWNVYLKENANDYSRTVKQIFKDGIEKISKEYNFLTKNRDLSKLAKPSAGLAFIRKCEKGLEYLLLGDCMISIKTGNKTKELQMQELPKLDNSVLDYMEKLYKNGEVETVMEARQKEDVKEMLKANRLKLNEPKGYWVLSFQKEAIDNALTGVIKLEKMELLLMSDGFYAITELYKKHTFLQIFDILKNNNNGLEDIYKELREIEENDPYSNKYTRFKKSDDATAVYINLDVK